MAVFLYGGSRNHTYSRAHLSPEDSAGAWLEAAPFFIEEGGQRNAHGLGARRRLCRLLEELQQPLSTSARQLSRGQPSSWDTSPGLDQACGVRGLGERLGGPTLLCPDVRGWFLALHGMTLQHTLDVASVMVEEYSRNRGRAPCVQPCRWGRESHVLLVGHGAVATQLRLSRFMVYCASHTRRQHVWRIYSLRMCRPAPRNSWI